MTYEQKEMHDRLDRIEAKMKQSKTSDQRPARTVTKRVHDERTGRAVHHY